MTRVIGATRYLIILPIIGLLLAAATLFVFGGIGLIGALLEGLGHAAGGIATEGGHALPFEVEIIEYVHRFMIGTVLFITAAGFYQLFIDEVDFPNWLQIDNTEELENNLVGVTVVVLAVQFMGIVFTSDTNDLLEYGVGIALPIAALSLFVGIRTWSLTRTKRSESAQEALEKRGAPPVETE